MRHLLLAIVVLFHSIAYAADSTIDALPENVAPDANDVFVIVDDPAGTPNTEQIKFSTVESALTITESQVSDLGNYSTVGHTHTESDITDLGNYSTVGHTHTESDITDLGNYSTVGHTHTESDITDLSHTVDTNLSQEQVEDYVDGVITAGSNVTVTYDDGANTLTIAATGGGGGGFTPNILAVYDTTGGLTVDNTQQAIIFDTEDVEDSNYTYDTVTGELTIDTTGLYTFDARCSVEAVDTTGGARGAPTIVLQENALGAGSFSTVPGAESSDYIRENGAGLLGAAMAFKKTLSVTATDEFRVIVLDSITSEPNERTKADTCSLHVEFVR